MKRLAAVLTLAGVLAIGVSSTASAAGDPAHARVDNCLLGFCHTEADVSVQKLLGPDIGVVCGPGSEIALPPIAPYALIGSGGSGPVVSITICEQ